MSAELIQHAIRCLAVQGVYLRETQFTQSNDFDATLPQGFELAVQHRAVPEALHLVEIKEDGTDVKHNLMNVRFSCGLRLIDAHRVKDNDPATGVVGEIAATFVAQYLILPDTKPSRAALDAFAKSNAGYHVWPYWREYIQSICARAGLPVVTIPMYQIPKEHQAKKAGSIRKRVKTDGKPNDDS